MGLLGLHMKYIEVLLGWDLLSIFLIFVAFAVDYNLNYFLVYFFTGHFLILLFGLVEVIKKDRGRNKK